MSKVICIASGKGGVGKSSVTSGIASCLAAEGFRVLCLDFDISLRCLDIMLGVSEKVVFDWGDFALGRCDAAQCIVECGENLFLAASPAESDDNFTTSVIARMVNSVRNDYDFVLIDAPAGVQEGFLLAASAADSVILVSTPDLVCVRSCSAAGRILRNSGKENIRLIINRFNSKAAVKGRFLNIDDCIDAAGVQLLGVVPEDRLVTFSPEVEGRGEGYSPAGTAYERIARRLCGEDVPLVVE